MNFASIWSYILKTNTFNFIIFAILIVIICRALKVSDMIEGMRKKTEKTVNDSVDAKDNAKKSLDESQKKMDNIKNDIDKIVKESADVTKNLSDDIINQAKIKIGEIENSTQKVFANDLKITKKNLSKLATKASLELTQENLKKKLEQDKALHQVFIDEAIEKLETVEI